MVKKYILFLLCTSSVYSMESVSKLSKEKASERVAFAEVTDDLFPSEDFVGKVKENLHPEGVFWYADFAPARETLNKLLMKRHEPTATIKVLHQWSTVIASVGSIPVKETCLDSALSRANSQVNNALSYYLLVLQVAQSDQSLMSDMQKILFVKAQRKLTGMGYLGLHDASIFDKLRESMAAVSLRDGGDALAKIVEIDEEDEE